MAAIAGISAISQIGTGLSTNAVTSVGTAGSTGSAGAVGSQGSSSFLDSIQEAMGQLNTSLTSTDASVSSFAAGGSADLHTVMLEMQQASLELKLGVQVRDKLLEAYQDIMRLQV